MIKNILASLGILLLIFEAYNFIQKERINEKYWRNISKVKVGMTLEEARKIIGDYKYESWTQDNKSGEIIVSRDTNGKLTYAVEYDMVFGGSDNPKIFFDPNTLIVTEILNGE